MSEPKERPILFKGHMVRAILERRKTQTRRILKNQPTFEVAKAEPWVVSGELQRRDSGMPLWILQSPEQLGTDLSHEWGCAYGAPGDLLWVRETIYGEYEAKLPNVAPKGCTTIGEAGNYWYAADEEVGQEHTVTTPSIFMPQWASRISLEIKEVRLEKVEDCSEEDAIAEGFKSKAEFLETFYSINPKCCGLNPYVWAVTFCIKGEGGAIE
jgi:hypothetical protein